MSSKMEKEDREDFNKAFNYLREERKKVIDTMIYANAWYALQKKKGNGEEHQPKLSAICRYEDIKNVFDKKELEEKVPFSIRVSDQEIEKEISYLREEPVARIRGKYFEQTMHRCFTKIIQEGNKKNKEQIMFYKSHKINMNVGESNMISVLSSYAEVPMDLIVYINNHLGKLLEK